MILSISNFNNIFIDLFQMGQMCSNPLEYLIEQYGEDVGKFIMIEKTQEYLNKQFPIVKEKLSNETKEFSTKTIGEIDTQSSSCITKINATINQLKQSKKTEFEMFEKTSGTKVEDTTVKKVSS